MKVTILMADMCSSTSVSAAMEFFECVNAMHRFTAHSGTESSDSESLFHLETASITGSTVSCTGGLKLMPEKALPDVQDTDLIIVPGFMFNIIKVLPSLSPVVNWLRQQYDEGCYIAGMCTGAFVVAETGLLDYKSATTHWLFAEQFQNRFPSVKLQIERTVTDDGLLMCSGGSTSASDLLLHIIRRFSSPQLAAECAKRLLVDIKPKNQAAYSKTTFKKGHTDAVILKSQIWMEKRLDQSIQLEKVSEEFNMGTRNFIRRFKEATEQTPNQYLQNLRVEKAKHLLESSSLAFEQITLKVGYEDGNSFRRLFKSIVGIAPGEYRKRFQF